MTIKNKKLLKNNKKFLFINKYVLILHGITKYNNNEKHSF